MISHLSGILDGFHIKHLITIIFFSYRMRNYLCSSDIAYGTIIITSNETIFLKKKSFFRCTVLTLSITYHFNHHFL